MRKQGKPLLAGGLAGIQERAVGLVRPGVEAVLLAAVALGCAQAGWSLLAPNSAGASSANSDTAEPARVAAADIRSPFAPDAAGADAASHAAAALLASVQLAGVRMSIDPSMSGAVFTLDGQTQRAFVVGQEISPGVRLAEVQHDYVLLSYDGGQQQIAMPSAPTFSFARALMGESQAAPAPASVAVSSNVAAAPVQPAGATWITLTLSRVETAANGERGWRVGSPLPPIAAQVGLQEGDLILSINGAGPDNPAAALSAAAAGEAELSVLRGADGRISITIENPDRT